MRAQRFAIGLLCGLVAGTAEAHSFGVIYTLPVPFWLYAWAASAALLLSFVIVGVYATQRFGVPQQQQYAAGSAPHQIPASLLILLRALSLAAWLLCIATGLFGSNNPYGNFNMTCFWIVFMLGFAYLTALVGDLYSRISPFSTLTRRLPQQGCLTYPSWAGYTPALLWYVGLIWLELFGGRSPQTLAWALLGYSTCTLIGVAVFGSRDWLRYGECLGVFFRLIAALSPVAFVDEHSGRFRLRKPFSGLLDAQKEHPSLLLFVLFMLSATAYDGLHEARPWVELYWVTLYRELLSHWLGHNPIAAFPVLRQWYVVWQSGWLLLSPWLYLALYLLSIALMQWLLRLRGQITALALAFLPSLLPIVLVYHITHYYTLIETQGIRIIALASDPFGWGWNLFGTARWFQRIFVPDTALVWHVQVALILAGHIVSVVVAHQIALQRFGNRRAATLSQLPMLALMVAFTVAGLWILSQPISVSR